MSKRVDELVYGSLVIDPISTLPMFLKSLMRCHFSRQESRHGSVFLRRRMKKVLEFWKNPVIIHFVPFDPLFSPL